MQDRNITNARRYSILEFAQSRGDMSFDEIRNHVKPHVSDPTLRADINALVHLPQLVKGPHGGLQTRPPSIFDKTYFGDNLVIKSDKKDEIAHRLVFGEPPFEDYPLINRYGDTIVVGPGTSTLAVLRVLAELPSVEILTTNLGVLEIPSLLLKPSLHLSGGWVLSSVASLVGIEAIRNISAFEANSAVISVSGLAATGENKQEVSLYCHHEVQLPVKKALIEGRQKVIVVTCGDKIGKRDAFPFAIASEIIKKSNLYVITDCVQENVYKEISDCFSKLSKNSRYTAKIIAFEKG